MGWEFLPVCPVGQKRKLRDCWCIFFFQLIHLFMLLPLLIRGRKENLVVVGGRRKEGKKERKMEEWKNGKRLDFVPLLLTTATTIYCC